MDSRTTRSVLRTVALLALCSSTPRAQDAFDSWVSYATGGGTTARHPYDATSGDFDGDGDMDLAIANWWNFPKMCVLFNDGTGVFSEPVTYAGRPSYEIETADLDGDGHLDILLADHGQNGGLATVSVYWNRTDGTFMERQPFPTGSGPIGIAVADYDGDGDLDIATADQSGWDGTTVSVLSNLGGRMFSAPTAYYAAAGIPGFTSAPYRLEPADMDGDGLVDLVVGNDDQYVTVLMNTGSGFGAPVSVSTGMGASAGFFPALLVEDLDADGDLDVIYSNHLTQAFFVDPVLTQGGAIAVFRNDGTGTLAPAEPYGMQGGMPGFADMKLADVTGDGVLDILGVWQASGGWGMAEGDGHGGFGLATDFTSGDEPMALEVFDAEGDGDLDAIVVSRQSIEAGVHLNPGDGDFLRPDGHAQAGNLGNRHMDSGDIDGDGDVDVAICWAANNFGAVEVLFNDGTGSLGPAVVYPSAQAASDVRLRDINGDGALDLVWADDVLDPPYNFKTRINNGDGTFGPENGWYMGSCGTFDLELYDLEGDGDLDVILGEYLACFGVVTQSMIISRNNGDGTFGLPYRVYGDTIGAAAITGGDFDLDGNLDIVTATAGQLNIFPGRGNGDFDPYILLDLEGQTTELLSADFDGDGLLDLAIEGSDAVYDNALVVLLGHGDFTFGPPIAYLGCFSQSRDITAGDVDGDGDLDVVQCNIGSSTVSFYENNGDGTFQDMVRYGVAGANHDVTAADFDADGFTDVAVLMSQVGDLPANGTGVDVLFARPPCAGTMVHYGQGLGGTNGVVPVINGAGCPEVGSAMSLELVNALPNSIAYVFAGNAAASTPALGGKLLAGGNLVVRAFALDATGKVSLGFTLPSDPTLVGMVVYTQAFVADPGGPFGASISVGLEVHIQ